MKYSVGMTYSEINRNARDISGYFKKMSGDYSKKCYSGLKMILSVPDATFFVDDGGNIWEEYVPTYD